MSLPEAKIALENNRLRPVDRAVHDWYRFVLSFPPHLVRTYLDRFAVGPGQVVLDPFCGTGTTLVECKKLGIASVGIERNPMAHFASETKLNWTIDPHKLLADAEAIARIAKTQLRSECIEDDPPLPLFGKDNKSNTNGDLRSLHPETTAILLKASISPLPLHKVLALLDAISRVGGDRYRSHEQLALSRVIVNGASNLEFGPEVGVGPPKLDAPVIGPWVGAVRAIANDLEQIKGQKKAKTKVHLTDARHLLEVLSPKSVDAVITSPPYPNEKDYTRTTRLESAILGLIRNKAELRALKQELVRSNTRSVYSTDADDQLVENHPEIQRIASAIEERRIELRKTSGFERMYARVTKLYFGGMARHLASLRTILRPGARLAYVVGDQASYLQVMIRTGEILADLARNLGYKVESIDLFRTRLATATREMLREEVVVLRWPGAPQDQRPAHLVRPDRRANRR